MADNCHWSNLKDPRKCASVKTIYLKRQDEKRKNGRNSTRNESR